MVLRQPRHDAPQLLRKVVFLHNPKAAGVSIGVALQDHLGNMRISPPIVDTFSRHHRLAGYYQGLRGYDVYTGHIGRDLFEAVNDGHAVVTNFRKPLPRILSLYNYYRHRVGANHLDSSTPAARMNHACAIAAHTLDFDDFVRCDNPFVRLYISDFHYRQLTHSPWEPPLPGVTLADACAFVDRMTCIYVCEEPGRSERLFRERLGIERIGRENVGDRSAEVLRASDVSPSTVKLVAELNQRDQALYDHALNWLAHT
jgi:hypothetical protein